jgi:hypothetical protein
MRHLMRWLTPVLALGALLALTVSAQAGGGIKIQTSLTGSGTYAGVHGKATYKAKGAERQLEVEIEDANKLRGQLLTVKVGSTTIGTMRVNNFGAAEIERNSQAGQKVPTVGSGTRVTVTTSSGALVVSGSFR